MSFTQMHVGHIGILSRYDDGIITEELKISQYAFKIALSHKYALYHCSSGGLLAIFDSGLKILLNITQRSASEY